MKSLLGEEAVLIGFTGTPLLKRDKQSSIEKFGPYIHTYRYDEAVRDGVVLDLRYEARDIDQDLTSQAKIDQWFESKTSRPDQPGQGPGEAALGHHAVRPKLVWIESKKLSPTLCSTWKFRDRLKSGHG